MLESFGESPISLHDKFQPSSGKPQNWAIIPSSELLRLSEDIAPQFLGLTDTSFPELPNSLMPSSLVMAEWINPFP